MAKIDIAKLSLEEKQELLGLLEPAIKSDRAKQLEPTKKHIEQTFNDLLKKANDVRQIESDYVAPWTELRFDTLIKTHLQKHGEQTAAQIAAALGKEVTAVEKTLKKRLTGKKSLFVKDGEKYAVKQADSE
jgi:hypothetical protein